MQAEGGAEPAGAATDPPTLVPERREVLARMVTAATTPGGRLALVGEPGLGKSHLVDALVRALPAGPTVLFVRATGGRSAPFAGLAELLATLPDAGRDQLPAEQRELLARLPAAPGTAPADPASVEAAVVAVLARASGTGATVVVDEWQWLDPQTLDLLTRVLERPDLRERVAVVVAGRRPPADDTARARFFAPEQVVRLDPLGPAAIATILQETGLGDLPPATVATVAEDSRGNPLWAVALATARVTGDPRGRAATGPAHVVDHRLGSLPLSLRRVLASVALLGGARQAEVARVCDDSGAAAAEGLRRGLLRTDDGVLTVVDPRLARAAVQALTPETERELHGAIARLPLPLPRRAEHHDRAVAPGLDETLALELLDAARRARRSGDPVTAVGLARRALARTAAGSEAFPARAVEAAELALLTGDAGQVMEFLRVLDAATLPLPLFDRAASVLAAGTERAGGATAVARRFTTLQQVLVAGSAAWEVAEVHRTADAPPAGPDQPAPPLPPTLSARDTPRALAVALTVRARRRLDQGQGVDDELLARVRALDLDGSAPLETSADALAARWAYQADDVARSRTALAAFVRAAELAGETYAVVDGLAHAAALEVLTGHLGLAGTSLRRAEEHARPLPVVPPSVYRARGVLALAQDDRGGLDDLLTGPLDAAALGRADLLRAEVVGLDAAGAGRWGEAVEELGRARALAAGRGIAEPARRLWVDVELVRALVHLGRLPAAAAVVAELTPVGERPGRVHARGQALRLRALLAWRSGDLETALPLSERALGDLHAGGYRPQLVRAQLERVAMLRAAGRPVQARGLSGSATSLATAIGDPRLLAEVEQVGSALAATDGRSALTPAELRVARAAASGQANRDIAGDLFVSVRTVETHLANAYRKLGVRTRTQLALSLNDLPLASGGEASRRSR